MGVKSERYKEFYKYLSQNINETFACIAETWESFAAPFRYALKDSHIYPSPEGSYYCQGQRISLEHFFFPEYLEVSPAEFGKSNYIWKNVLHIQAKPTGMGMYSLQVAFVDDCSSSDIAVLMEKMNLLDPQIASKFAIQCQLRLCALHLQRIPLPHLLTGWNPKKNTLQYNIIDLPISKYDSEPPKPNMLGYVRADVEAIFFSATIFSLLKTQFYRMKILSKEELDFALYVYAMQPVTPSNFEDYLECMDNYADLFCNFRTWDDMELDSEFRGAKFRIQADRKSHSLSWWNHLYFPIVFTNYPRNQDLEYDLEYPPVEAPSVKYSHKLFGELSCLPIILFSQSAVGGAATKKKIVSLRWDTKRTTEYIDWFDRNEKVVAKRHDLIMGGYIRFLNTVSRMDYKQFKKLCRESKSFAYKELGIATSAQVTVKNHHAAILCGLYVAQACSEQDVLFRSAAKNAIRYLKTQLVHGADERCFANFVADQLLKTDNVIFYHDDTGIYLHYKQYWPAFQTYCKNRGIVLTVSAAQFRRTVLKNYIRPQYQASGDNYPRYDYRKKVDGQEATVLNVDPKILKLLKS